MININKSLFIILSILIAPFHISISIFLQIQNCLAYTRILPFHFSSIIFQNSSHNMVQTSEMNYENSDIITKKEIQGKQKKSLIIKHRILVFIENKPSDLKQDNRNVKKLEDISGNNIKIGNKNVNQKLTISGVSANTKINIDQNITNEQLNVIKNINESKKKNTKLITNNSNIKLKQKKPNQKKQNIIQNNKNANKKNKNQNQTVDQKKNIVENLTLNSQNPILNQINHTSNIKIKNQNQTGNQKKNTVQNQTLSSQNTTLNQINNTQNKKTINQNQTVNQKKNTTLNLTLNSQNTTLKQINNIVNNSTLNNTSISNTTNTTNNNPQSINNPIQNCLQIQSTNPLICKLCNNISKLSQNKKKCYTVHQFCKIYDQSGICKECNVGNYMDNLNICNQIPILYCANYQITTKKCTKCANGYFLIERKRFSECRQNKKNRRRFGKKKSDQSQNNFQIQQNEENWEQGDIQNPEVKSADSNNSQTQKGININSVNSTKPKGKMNQKTRRPGQKNFGERISVTQVIIIVLLIFFFN